jgi:FeS assembly protein IscX
VKLTWNDPEEIAWILLERHPQQDPLRLSFPKLQKLILEIPEFCGSPEGANERILESIQMAWLEEKGR